MEVLFPLLCKPTHSLGFKIRFCAEEKKPDSVQKFIQFIVDLPAVARITNYDVILESSIEFFSKHKMLLLYSHTHSIHWCVDSHVILYSIRIGSRCDCINVLLFWWHCFDVPMESIGIPFVCVPLKNQHRGTAMVLLNCSSDSLTRAAFISTFDHYLHFHNNRRGFQLNSQIAE